MKAKNKVMNGEYNGKIVGCVPTHAFIILGFTKSIRLTKENVESYELLNSECLALPVRWLLHPNRPAFIRLS